MEIKLNITKYVNGRYELYWSFAQNDFTKKLFIVSLKSNISIILKYLKYISYALSVIIILFEDYKI